MEEEEIWKDIKDYAGYQVSNLGNVRTHNKFTYTEKHGCRKWGNRKLKFKSNDSDYYRVDLWKDGKPHTKLVHRLVAEAFINNDYDYPIVNHKDENKHNNKVDNLEWCDYKYNNNYGKMEIIRYIYLKINDEIMYFKNKSEASMYIGRNKNYISNNLYYKRKLYDANGNEVILVE